MIPVHIAGVGMTQFGKSSNPLVARLAVERDTAEEISRLSDLHQLLKLAHRKKIWRDTLKRTGGFIGSSLG